MYRRNRRVINSSAEPPPVVLASQEETPAVPDVPGSQASTPVGLTQQEGHHSSHLYLTLRCKQLLLERLLVWGDSHCGWQTMSLRDLSSLSLNNDHKLFDIVVVTVDHPSWLLHCLMHDLGTLIITLWRHRFSWFFLVPLHKRGMSHNVCHSLSRT